MSEKYECFEDLSYYGKWAVREVGATEWGDCWHVDSKEEAEGLCAVLNSYESKLAVARKVLATLQPFVMEDFYPNCATPDYKDAVTKMNDYLQATESEGE